MVIIVNVVAIERLSLVLTVIHRKGWCVPLHIQGMSDLNPNHPPSAIENDLLVRVVLSWAS